jgi:gliding motility-associated-like protein
MSLLKTLLLSLLICVASLVKSQITGFQYQLQDDSCYLGYGALKVDSVIGGIAPFRFALDTLDTNLTGSFKSLKAGDYFLFVTDSLGNSFGESVSLSSSDTAFVNYGVDPITGLDDGRLYVKEVLAGPNPDYHYLQGENYPATDTFLSDLRIPETGTFTVHAVAPNGCISVRTVTISAALPRTENFFSPNGDGNNDTWTIASIDYYPNNRVVVFNRFGQRVFGTKDYQNDWDGKQLGQDLPEGTYYFVFYHDVDDDSKGFQKGFVEIIR